MLRLLQDRGFDAAVIFTTYSQSPLPAALPCYVAGIPLRLVHCGENPYPVADRLDAGSGTAGTAVPLFRKDITTAWRRWLPKRWLPLRSMSRVGVRKTQLQPL